MHISRLDPDHPHWQMLTAHLAGNGDASWVLDQAGKPNSDHLVFLGAMVDGMVVGSLTLLKQPIEIPATEWAGDRDLYLRDVDGSVLYELFVQTFSVDEAYRRRGIGRALQEEALRQTRMMGCYQLRSWSSLDKIANYPLKLGLRFAFHPAIYQTESGLKVSGGYFIRVIQEI